MTTHYRSSLVGYYQVIQRPVFNFAEMYLSFQQRSPFVVAGDELIRDDLIVDTEDELPYLYLWTLDNNILQIDRIRVALTTSQSSVNLLASARRINLNSMHIYQMLVTYREITHRQAVLSRVALTSLRESILFIHNHRPSALSASLEEFTDNHLSSINTLSDIEAIVLTIESVLILSDNLGQSQ